MGQDMAAMMETWAQGQAACSTNGALPEEGYHHRVAQARNAQAVKWVTLYMAPSVLHSRLRRESRIMIRNGRSMWNTLTSHLQHRHSRYPCPRIQPRHNTNTGCRGMYIHELD